MEFLVFLAEGAQSVAQAAAQTPPAPPPPIQVILQQPPAGPWWQDIRVWQIAVPSLFAFLGFTFGVWIKDGFDRMRMADLERGEAG